MVSGAAGFGPSRRVIWCLKEEEQEDDVYRGVVERGHGRKGRVGIGRFYNHLALPNLPGETSDEACSALAYRRWLVKGSQRLGFVSGMRQAPFSDSLQGLGFNRPILAIMQDNRRSSLITRVFSLTTSSACQGRMIG